MTTTQKRKATLIGDLMREAAMNPVTFDAALVIGLVSWVLLLMAFVRSPV